MTLKTFTSSSSILSGSLLLRGIILPHTATSEKHNRFYKTSRQRNWGAEWNEQGLSASFNEWHVHYMPHWPGIGRESRFTSSWFSLDLMIGNVQEIMMPIHTILYIYIYYKIIIT